MRRTYAPTDPNSRQHAVAQPLHLAPRVAGERLAAHLPVRMQDTLGALVADPLQQRGRVHQVSEQDRDRRGAHRLPSYNLGRAEGKARPTQGAPLGNGAPRGTPNPPNPLTPSPPTPYPSGSSIRITRSASTTMNNPS